MGGARHSHSVCRCWRVRKKTFQRFWVSQRSCGSDLSQRWDWRLQVRGEKKKAWGCLRLLGAASYLCWRSAARGCQLSLHCGSRRRQVRTREKSARGKTEHCTYAAWRTIEVFIMWITVLVTIRGLSMCFSSFFYDAKLKHHHHHRLCFAEALQD